MDLSVIQKNRESMGVEGFANQIGSHVFNLKDTFTETDVKGNNNLFHIFKTENTGHGHDPSSLFQDDHPDENNTKLENSACSPLKKAIDLRVHNRTLDGGRRTIFEDADYFAKNFCYKLLPINFENVDETIIHTEHNYSLFSLCSESETEEDCSRTMDYSQIKEKNYKRRRTKFREGSEENKWDEEGIEDKGQDFNLNGSISEDLGTEALSETEHSFAVQPLDLSSPLVQEEKTEHHQTEHPTSIVANQEGEENKENVNSKLGCIEVTITRPDEKENYQPCDLFLNDIARLVPRLIEKNCSGIDILDKTCERYHVDIQRHRLYYIIAESTWKLFQSTKERIILTNDGSLGEPVQRREIVSRPTFLVFDQFSLAKCLADYCQEIGGCFEYTFLEATKNLEQIEGQKEEEVVKIKDDVVNEDKEKVEEIVEKEMVGKEKVEEIVEKEMVEKEKVEEIVEKEMVEKETMEEIVGKESITEDEVPNCGEILLPGDVVAEQKTELSELSKTQKSSPEVGIKIKENNPAAEVRPKGKEKYPQQKLTEKVTKTKAARRETNPYRSKQPNHNSYIKTRSKSTSESSETPNNVKTSQKGEERSSKRGRNKQEEKVPVKEEIPEKRRKVSAYKGPRMGTKMERRTRSGKSLDVEIGKTNKKPKARDKKQKIARKQEEETMRTRLRSRKGTQGNEGNKRKLLQRRR